MLLELMSPVVWLYLSLAGNACGGCTPPSKLLAHLVRMRNAGLSILRHATYSSSQSDPNGDVL